MLGSQSHKYRYCRVAESDARTYSDFEMSNQPIDSIFAEPARLPLPVRLLGGQRDARCRKH